MTNYMERARAKCAALAEKENPILLAIESSCDETAAAVLAGGRTVLSTAVHTQIPLHRRYGGVVPELASRNHVEMIAPVVEHALEKANLSYADIDAIAVTCGPGLVGAVLVGVNYAKGLALALDVPFVGVHHIAGHIAANYLTYPDLEPPFVCLVASGGHSHIVHVKDYTHFELLGRTRDDAAGEAFDKVARALGLPYPGGPHLEKLALEGNAQKYRFHSAFNEHTDSLDFSFSGMKTAAVNLMQHEPDAEKADVAASFQRAVVAALSKKSVFAAKLLGVKTLALAGGVSANTALREKMERDAMRAKLRFCRPDMAYCTDNAAMIGCAGYYALRAGRISSLALNAYPSLALDADMPE